MRKIFVGLFAVMVGVCLVYAQGNQATVQQQSSNNFAKIEQTGSNQIATVTQQTGDGNVIGTVGEPAAGGIVQNGSENRVEVLQDGSGNRISQYRPSQNVYNAIFQDGDRNEVYITQVGNDQVVGLKTYAYHAGVEQRGDQNSASIWQGDGVANRLEELFQSGAGHQATVEQHGNENVVSRIHQYGSFNNGEILQFGNENTAHMDANGRENRTRILQGNATPGTEANEATQWVNGEKNVVTIMQDGAGYNKAFQHLPSTAWGSENTATIIQEGQYNDAYQKIMGSENVAIIESHGDYNGTTDIDGDGSADRVQIIQNGDLNRAEIYQYGSYNGVIVTQNGDGHAAYVEQNGDGNKAIIYQSN